MKWLMLVLLPLAGCGLTARESAADEYRQHITTSTEMIQPHVDRARGLCNDEVLPEDVCDKLHSLVLGVEKAQEALVLVVAAYEAGAGSISVVSSCSQN